MATVDDSTAIHINPAALAVTNERELSYYFTYDISRDVFLPDRGLFAKFAPPSFGSFRSNFGFAYAHLQDDSVPLSDGSLASTSYHKFQFANGTTLGSKLYLGISYAVFVGERDSSPYHKVQSLNLSWLIRASQNFAMGFMVRDINRPFILDQRVDRRYVLSYAWRPVKHRFSIEWEVLATSQLFRSSSDQVDPDNPVTRFQNLGLNLAFQMEPVDGLHFFIQASNWGTWSGTDWDDMPLHFQIGFSLGFGGGHIRWDNYTGLGNTLTDYSSGIDHRIGMGAQIRSYRHPTLIRRPHDYLEIKLDHTIVEQPTGTPLDFFTSSTREKYFSKYLIAINKAVTDDRIAGIVLYLNNHQLGLAQMQELRYALKQIKEAGKKVICHMNTAGTADYYLASLADEIYLLPVREINLRGMYSSVFFLKGLLEKIGVSISAFASGPYKTGPNPLTESELTEEHREVVTYMLDSIHDYLVKEIASDRGLEVETLQEWIDHAPIQPEQAVERSLVTDLAYYDDVFQRYQPISLETYLAYDAYDPNWEVPPTIATLYITGTIQEGKSDSGSLFMDGSVGDDTIIETIKELRTNPRIAGVLIRIDSGGGSGYASDRIAHAIKALGEEKPVVVSMGNYAASGGYYIAMGANHLVASPLTITASIGVFSIKPNYAQLLEKLGITYEEIQTGEQAGLQQTPRELTEEELGVLQEDVDAFYMRFLSVVSEGRDIEVEALKEISKGGRVWLGMDALEHGLIDEVGGFFQALELLKDFCGIETDDKVQMELYPRSDMSIFSMMQSPLFTDHKFRLFLNYMMMASSPDKIMIFPYSLETR